LDICGYCTCNHGFGLKPVFADCNLDTHLIDIEHVRRLIGVNTCAVLGLQAWGLLCSSELEVLCESHEIPLILDAAHSFACGDGKRKSGQFGTIEVFSFHATKFFNSIEGGAICTKSRELAEKIRLMRNFGFAGIDNVVCWGTNAKMSEIHAAMGLSNFPHIDELIRQNKCNYEAYEKELADIPGIELACRLTGNATSNYQYVVCHVDKSLFGASADDLATALGKVNVIARRYFKPCCHRMPPYAESNTNSLPTSERLANITVVLPTGMQVYRDDDSVVKDICDRLKHIQSFAPKK